MEFIYTEDQLDEIAAQILRSVTNGILCFYGQLGAGKTSLIKALVKKLGGAQQGNSPSFGIVNEYSRKDGSLLGYHFDFYRLEDETEALDLGLEDYLAQECWIFIEWPEKIATLIPENAKRLVIEVLDTGTRKLSLDVQDGRPHLS